jgi:hypothetical protein
MMCNTKGAKSTNVFITAFLDYCSSLNSCSDTLTLLVFMPASLRKADNDLVSPQHVSIHVAVLIDYRGSRYRSRPTRKITAGKISFQLRLTSL